MSSIFTQIKDFAGEALPILGLGRFAATSLFGWNRPFETAVKELSPKQRARIEEAIKDFSKKLGITKEVRVICEAKPSSTTTLITSIDSVLGQSFGCNALPGDAGVKISINMFLLFQFLMNKDENNDERNKCSRLIFNALTEGILSPPEIKIPNLERFVIAHELSHIQQNHNLKLFVLAACTHLFQRSLCQSFSRGIISNLALKALCWIPFMLYSQHCEKQADKKVFEMLSCVEQEDVIKFMELLPSSFDPIHPSTQARAAYMKQWHAKIVS